MPDGWGMPKLASHGLSQEDALACQRYAVGWEDRERATRRMMQAQSRMMTERIQVRRALSERGAYDGELVTGYKFRLTLAPNGVDIMVLPR